MTAKEKQKQIIWSSVLIVVTLIFMVPLIFMVSMSLRTPDTIGLPQLFISDVTFKNYANVLRQNPDLWKNFMGSVIVTVTSVALVQKECAWEGSDIQYPLMYSDGADSGACCSDYAAEQQTGLD